VYAFAVYSAVCLYDAAVRALTIDTLRVRNSYDCVRKMIVSSDRAVLAEGGQTEEVKSTALVSPSDRLFDHLQLSSPELELRHMTE
jgi:hypothetical protein